MHATKFPVAGANALPGNLVARAERLPGGTLGMELKPFDLMPNNFTLS